ncbi:MAG: 50S ribosomal protein L28 [Candidatus Moranbacteria bacterium]|nr:50S ribosomal protein L28 [Candidatus Moranbacteria bacterium]
MAKSCKICGKSYNKANYVNKLRGQYNRCGIKIQKPNLQKRKIGSSRILICTDCIKTMVKIDKPKKTKVKTKK